MPGLGARAGARQEQLLETAIWVGGPVGRRHRRWAARQASGPTGRRSPFGGPSFTTSRRCTPLYP
eukprot:6780811-Alexandrium_andersonii.AAC.1